MTSSERASETNKQKRGLRNILLHGLTSSTAPKKMADSSAKYNLLETNNDSQRFMLRPHKSDHTCTRAHTKCGGAIFPKADSKSQVHLGSAFT